MSEWKENNGEKTMNKGTLFPFLEYSILKKAVGIISCLLFTADRIMHTRDSVTVQ